MESKDKITMYILAGPNGSGKSSILKKKIPEDVVSFNADVFSNEIAKERGIPDDYIQDAVNNSKALQIAGGKRLIERIEKSIEQNLKFSAETTLSTNAYKRHIKDAESNGFERTLLYVGTESPEINILRVANRVKKGGHYISPEDVVKRYYGSLQRLGGYIDMVDNAQIYDNSKHGENARLIISIEHGEIIKQNKPILKWINENVNKKLYPDLYKEVLQDSKKEVLQSARKELKEDGFIVNPKPGATYEGELISINEYYAVQKVSDMGILHELDKVSGLRDRDVGENLTIEYDGGDTAKIADDIENTISENENKIDIDEEFDI